MKTILFISVSVFWAFNGVCQQVQFTLYGKNPCTGTVEKLPFFGLMKDGVSYSVEDAKGVLVLKELGIYSLDYVLADIDSSQLGNEYEVLDRTSINDTLNMFSIYRCHEPTSHPSFVGYCCCGDKCEGEKVEYYSNGNKRIEGYFKNGVPYGVLKIYYPNGNLKQVERYNKNGKLIKRLLYDQSGE